MKRLIRSSQELRASQETYALYQNIRNKNKYIEVKKTSDGHTWMRQFMFWNTDRGPVKNYSGSKTNRGRYHRITIDSLKKILEDYNIVESVEDDVRDDFDYVGSDENPNDVM